MTFWLAVISIVISLNSSFDLQGAFDRYREELSPTIYTNEVLESKSKHNYYSEGQYDVKYSFNALCSDAYWVNLYSQLNSNDNQSMILLGGTTQITYYQFINNNTTWTASSSLLDSMYFGFPNNGNIILYAHEDVYFTNCTLRSFRYGSEKLFYLHFDYVAFEVSSYVEFIYCFIDNVPYGGGIMYSNINNTSRINVENIFSFPKSNCALSINAATTADYDSGYSVGYNKGYNNGYNERQIEYNEEVYNNGYNVGYQEGRTAGIEDASASSGVPAMIFTGILNVALLPVDIFLQMFQYEVFGINIAGLISGLLTVCMVIIIIRFLFGGKGGKDD